MVRFSWVLLSCTDSLVSITYLYPERRSDNDCLGGICTAVFAPRFALLEANGPEARLRIEGILSHTKCMAQFNTAQKCIQTEWGLMRTMPIVGLPESSGARTRS